MTEYMIKMTPAAKGAFQTIVAAGISMVRLGRSIESVRMHMERDPIVGYSPFTVDKVMGEIEFWVGKKKSS